MKSDKDNLWTVVAYRTGVRIYKFLPGHENRGVSLVQKLDNPDGFLKDSELGSDRPGRSFDSVGGGRHSLSSQQSPSQHVMEVFAKKIAGIIEEARTNSLFSKFVLIAGPAFLGLLRKSLSSQTLAHLVHSLNKDFVNLSDHEMKIYLETNMKNFLVKV